MIEINWNPSKKELRIFAILQIVFFGIVSWRLYSKTGSLTLALSLFGISAVVGIVGFCLPKFMRIVYVVWMTAVMPIGWVVSRLMLGIVFYLVIAPIGLVMVRIIGRDPLQRRFDKNAKTYWIRRTPEQNTKRYFRQF